MRFFGVFCLLRKVKHISNDLPRVDVSFIRSLLRFFSSFLFFLTVISPEDVSGYMYQGQEIQLPDPSNPNQGRYPL